MASHPGERVVFRGHPSWLSLRRVYVKGFILGLVLGVAAGLVAAALSGRVQTSWVVAGVLVGFAWRASRGQLRRLRTTYAVTDRRVTVHTRGMIRRQVTEVWLEEIVDVRTHQSMLDRMLGIGSVHIVCDTGHVAFRGIDDPVRVARAIDRAADEAQRFVVHDARVPA